MMMYKWDVERALDYIESERVTTLAAAPAMVLDILEAERFAETDTSSLFSVGVGGAATPPRVGSLLREKMPENFSGTGYGMTETNAQGASLTGKAFHQKTGTAGFPHPVVDIRICDENDVELPQGQTGEIWVRSVTNIVEYWHRPEANASDFRDGWLKTGDIGYLDEDGFLFLADRAKDMIIRGGQNIYPAEVEGLLNEHPKVSSVAIVGYPDRAMGEKCCAYVIPKPGETFTFDEMVDFLKEKQLAMFKLPERLEVVDEFPAVGDSGKVNRETLKQMIKEKVEAEQN